MRIAPLVVVTLLLATGTVSAAWGMPEPLTPRGETVDDLYVKVTIAGAIVFVVVFALLVWVLVRYREGSGHGKSTHEAHRGSLAAEMVWTLIPLAVVLWVGWIGYQGLLELDEGIATDEAEMTIHVNGYRYGWRMGYGDGVIVEVTTSPDAVGVLTYTDTFHVPADTNILLNITGDDLIHAFNIMDANRAYFSMNDANPFGPHKYAEVVVNFPVGEYSIQCKEMCLNPGHAYMRAKLIAEPKAAFDEWKADQVLLGTGSSEFVEVTAMAGKLTFQDPAPSLVIAGTRIGIKIHNGDNQVATVSLNGVPQGSVAPMGTSRVGIDAAAGATYNVTVSNGGSFTIGTVTPDFEIPLDLKEFAIVPPHLEMQVGKGYLIEARNIGSAAHNLFIGQFGGEILAQSNLASGGGVALLYFKPTTAGELEMWCNVSGHHGLGMKGTITVSA